MVAASVTALSACSGSPATTSSSGSLNGPYQVVRVVDGDTIIVNRDGDDIRVRLIGINTPESVAPDRPVECFGPEASARTKELASGKSVWLEYDPVAGELDKYGRTLAYVWLTPDQSLNEELVREGFAREYTYNEGFRYEQRYKDAQSQAQQQDLGLWKACPVNTG